MFYGKGLSLLKNLGVIRVPENLISRTHIVGIVAPSRRSHISSRQASSPQDENCDFVIAGGGMVGLGMACALVKEERLKGKKIILLEKGVRKEVLLQKDAPYSNRVVALNPSTKKFLEDIGVWDIIASVRFQAVKRLQVWETHSDAMITFNHDALTEDVAYIVENDLITEALCRVAENEPNLDLRFQTQIKNYDVPSVKTKTNDLRWARVTLSDDSMISSKLLIGADGWGSRVREAMGVKHVGWDYDQTAIVATLRLSEATANNVAWQRFLPTGPLALLPLNSQQSSLVWSTTKKEASRLMSLTEEEFTDALNHAIWDDKHRIRGIDDVLDRWRSLLGRVLDLGMSVRQLPPSIMAIEGGSRACFPLGLGHATEYVRLRAALIGDAAHRIHPMAGQGVNMGFADAVALTKCLSRAVYEGRDVGNLSHLLEYETERQRQVVPTLATVDGLYRLYSTQFSPIVLLRSLGLSFTNAFSPAKRVIMARTSV